MLIQTPLPPLPPIAPEAVIVSNGPPEGVVIMMIMMTLIISAAVVLRPLVRAWAKRLEGSAASPELLNELEHLRDRVAELEGVQGRLAELEDRIDFSERLLARQGPEKVQEPGRARE